MNKNCEWTESVTADKGCYKTEASPAVADKGRTWGGFAQQEAAGEEGEVVENKKQAFRLSNDFEVEVKEKKVQNKPQP